MTELATQVSLTIDGVAVAVPPGTLVIRAAEMIGVQIPRFCDHPLLAPVGACRQCLVEVEGQRKPMASCTIPVTDGMVVNTALTSPSAEKAQRGVMELLLINHPLDCPICDKGGECPLQNQAMSTGAAQSRFDGVKRTFPKLIPLSTEVLLDRERCVLCARCTRFSEQIAGDPFIELLERGAAQQVGVSATEPLDSYFSGNTVQICPVGALTSAAYRFRARPFDLVSTPSVCEHCASGCAQRTDHRGGHVLRRMAGDDPEVNEEWNCDKGRWAFTYREQSARIDTPLVRGASGDLEPASWSHALGVAAAGLTAAAERTAVLVGGRSTAEDAYAYAKFARTVLRTNDIDFRDRPHSTEESEFLAARIAGTPMTVTYRDLETASVVLLVGFDPEEESPIAFLRLRKAVRTRGSTVLSIAPFASRGLTKMSGTLIATAPGDEATTLAGLRESDLLGGPGASNSAVILVGERLADSPGALTAVVALADATGARLAWVPRRAGERGALDVGALPTLLPGGRPVADPAARQEVASVWGVDDLPTAPGRDTDAILAAARAGDLDALVVGGVDPTDLADPEAATRALTDVGFLVSLELRHSAVTDLADVVLPVAAAAEKSGTFVNWEGRPRPFAAAMPGQSMSDLRVLDALADRMGTPLHLADPATALAEIATIGAWTGSRATDPAHDPAETSKPGRGEAILASWRMLLDDGRLQDHEPHLAGTARPAVARLSPDTAAEIGVHAGDPVTVGTARGSVTAPCEITPMPDRVVWLPLNSTVSLNARLGPAVGGVVTIALAPAASS